MSNCYFKDEIAVSYVIYEANTQNNTFMNTILLRIKIISPTLQCDNSKQQNIQNTLKGEGVSSFRCKLWSERNTPSQWYVDVDNSFAGFSLNDFKQVTYRSNDLKLDMGVYR